MVINQTSFVEMSVAEAISTSVSASTAIPLLQSNAPTIPTASETSDSSVPTDPPSMFSTRMAPPHPIPTDQEDLITTVASTTKDDTGDLADFDIDNFASENITTVEFVYQRGDIFHDRESTKESAGLTQSKPIEEQDDLSVIEINTIQPDVPMLDPSLITEPMFAKGKTEEAILDPGITAVMASDLTDNPTDTTEVTSEEVFNFPESIPPSTYDLGIDEIETDYGVEALPPAQPPQLDLSSSTSDITISDISTVIPTDTPFMFNTKPGSEVQITTTGPPEPTSTTTQTFQAQDVETPDVSAILLNNEELPEDSSVSESVQIFSESAAQLPQHSGDTLTEADPMPDIDPEFFTSLPMASVDHTTRPPSTVGTDEQSIQLTTHVHLLNATGKTS